MIMVRSMHQFAGPHEMICQRECLIGALPRLRSICYPEEAFPASKEHEARRQSPWKMN